MKWYDYCACIFFADLISAGAIQGNVVVLVIGWWLYFTWENFRKWEISSE